MGYNLGPLHWELSLQQYRANSSDHTDLQYYVGGGVGVEVQYKPAVTVNMKTAARYCAVTCCEATQHVRTVRFISV